MRGPQDDAARPRASLGDYLDGRAGWAAIGVAVAASISLALWITRGDTFLVDALGFFVANRRFDAHTLLTAVNGHLELIPRLIYAAGLDVFGADLTVYRVIEAFAVGAAGLLTFALVRRWIGGAVALAVTLPLLFFGTSWGVTVPSVSLDTTLCLVFGLGSLALLVTGRRGYADLAACLLLALALATFSAGLAFAVGVATYILTREDGLRRTWVFVVPVVAYGIWWALQPTGQGMSSGFGLSNVLLVPSYLAGGTAAVAAGLTGLSYDFAPVGPYGPSTTTVPFGQLLALAAVVGLVLALRDGMDRRDPIWPWLATLAAYWASIAMVASPARTPETNRYIYVGAVLTVIVGAAAANRHALGRSLRVAIAAVVALSLAANLAIEREAGRFLRSSSTATRADFAMIELARRHVDPGFVPSTGVLPVLEGAEAVPANLFPAFDRNGSPSYTILEVMSLDEPYREEADQVLAEALTIAPRAIAATPPGHGCRRADGRAFPIPRGGAVLRTGEAASLSLRRFGDGYSVHAGMVPAHRATALTIPRDAARARWWGQLAPSEEVTLCPLP